jgi:hypothetical protein
VDLAKKLMTCTMEDSIDPDMFVVKVEGLQREAQGARAGL